MNRSFESLKARLIRRGANLAHASTAAEIMCDILDEKEQLWFNDRNRYDERIKRLEAKVARLEERGPEK